jgi:long-chain fatty acid transport protein
MTQKFSMKLIPALMLLGFAGTASASGFAIQNQTGSGNGNAFAGAAAAAEDAGTIYFNPAGMTNLPKGHNISLSGTLLNRTIDFKNKGSNVNPLLGPGVAFFPLPTGDGGDAGGLALLPAGYWAYGISPNLSVGVGVGPTFGNKTEYQFDFIGRNAGYFFEMEQININPSIAYKLNDMVSIGGGINFAHNESTFKQGVPLVRVAVGYQPNNFLKVNAEDWAIGFNLGATFQLSPATRIGLAYRSELEFDMEGKQKYQFPTPGIVGVVPALANQDVKANLKTPANFSIAASHKPSDKLELLADVTWTDWSVVKALNLKNKQSGVPLHQLSYNFEDTYRVGLGASYQYNEQVKTRFGIAYDKTPVQHNEDRTMTLPDSDRIWLSFGVKYSLSKVSSIDLGYSHIFFDDAKTARAVTTGFPGPQTLRQTIRGSFDTTADILSAQYNHTF